MVHWRQPISKTSIAVVVGIVLFVGWQIVNVLDGGRYFLVPHVVRTYAEYCAYLGGEDLYRRHNVARLQFDCASIRASTLAALEVTLTAAAREVFPNESAETIDQYLVTVGEPEAGELFLKSAAGFDAQEFRAMVTGQVQSPSCDALVLRSLWSQIAISNGLELFEQIDVTPYPSPCSGGR